MTMHRCSLWRSLSQVIAFCLSSLLLTGAAWSDVPPEDPSIARVEQTISALARLPDADSLAAAGLLSSGRQGDQSLVLMGQAAAVSPLRADLLWLQGEICVKTASCDPAPIAARLREVDPANAAGWVGPLAEQPTDAALATLGHKQRFDTYFTTLVAKLSDAVIRLHTMSSPEAVVIVIGYLAAQPSPAYTAASKACKGERLEQPAVKQACRDIARVYQNGDTYLTEMMGTSIAKRVWPADSPQWKAAVEARRVFEYRSKLQQELYGWTYVEQFLNACSTHRREQDVWAALITAAGEDPNPPAIAP